MKKARKLGFIIPDIGALLAIHSAGSSWLWSFRSICNEHSSWDHWNISGVVLPPKRLWAELSWWSTTEFGVCQRNECKDIKSKQAVYRDAIKRDKCQCLRFLFLTCPIRCGGRLLYCIMSHRSVTYLGNPISHAHLLTRTRMGWDEMEMGMCQKQTASIRPSVW